VAKFTAVTSQRRSPRRVSRGFGSTLCLSANKASNFLPLGALCGEVVGNTVDDAVPEMWHVDSEKRLATGGGMCIPVENVSQALVAHGRSIPVRTAVILPAAAIFGDLVVDATDDLF